MMLQILKYKGKKGGFTLLELMTVMGIISLLLGIGIGLISKISSREKTAVGTIKARISAARNTARITGRPAWIKFIEDKGRTYIILSVVEPLVYIGFEYGGKGGYGISGKLEGGTVVDGGRFGFAMKHEQIINPGLIIDTQGKDYLNVDKGFIASVDVKIKELKHMVIFKWGNTFEIGLDEYGKPYANMTLKGVKGMPGKVIELKAKAPIPLLEWINLELSYDLERALLLVEGEKKDFKLEKGKPFVEIGTPMVVSSTKGPVSGYVDEVKFFGVIEEQPEPLPKGVTIKKGPKIIRFTKGGVLDPFFHGSSVKLVISFLRGKQRFIYVNRMGVVR